MATIGRTGARPGRRGRAIATVLLLDVRLVGGVGLLCDHVWQDLGNWAHSLNQGDRIQFRARLRQYRKICARTGLVDLEVGLTRPRLVLKL